MDTGQLIFIIENFSKITITTSVIVSVIIWVKHVSTVNR